MSTPALSLAEWARINKRVTVSDVDAHIHAGLRSAPQTKTYTRWYYTTLHALQDARDATSRDYEASVAAGAVTKPAAPTLQQRADDGNEAARRVLAKRAARKPVSP